MSLIRDLVNNEEMEYISGKFTSESLFNGEMNIGIFSDGDITLDYAEKCIMHYNKLKNNAKICERIQKKLEKFFLYMYNEWKEMDIYNDIVADTEKVMEEYRSGRPLVDFLSDPTLYVYPPQGDEIGYCIESECPWEPEHQCIIVIRGDNVMYTGPSEGEDPWGDEDDYYCIWEDED